jgi:FtsX-like permease family
VLVRGDECGYPPRRCPAEKRNWTDHTPAEVALGVFGDVSRVLRVAWYRFRVTLGRRWGGYLSVVMLIGLVGGLAMGAVAAARRTQSSFPAFLASTNPSDMTVFTGPVPLNVLARLPHVKEVESADVLNAAQLGPNGRPVGRGGSAGQVFSVGSVDGLLFNQDRVTVVDGRMASPRQPGQAVVTEQAAHLLGLHVGETVPVGFYTSTQLSSPGSGTAAVQPHARIDIKVVGIVVLNSAVVQDDAERSVSALVILTPALTARVAQCCGTGLTQFGLQLDRGNSERRSSEVSAVETEVERLLPAGAGFYVSVTSVSEAEAQRAIQPESLALGVFGGIAVLATLLIAGQVIGRQLRIGAGELGILRALGAGPVMTSSDGLVGILGAVILGSLLAAAVAASLSPLGPIGPVRPVYPTPGVAFDRPVLGFGTLGLVVVLSALAGLFAYQQAPHRASRQYERVKGSSRLDRAGLASGLPLSALTGVRFALESGRIRDTAPMRSAIVGTAVAVSVITSALTFGASLNTLVSHPNLYGWNWSYELDTPEGGGYIPEHEAAQLLERDPDVEAWTGVYFDSLRVAGQTIPIIGGTPNAPVGPPILSGRTLEARNEIVLGPTTLAELHKRVGDTVEASYGTVTKRTRLLIVGTATMPAVGPGLGLHLSMGTGALVSDLLIPANVRDPASGPPGPAAIFVRLRARANPVASLRSLQKIDATLDSDPNAAPMSVLPVQRPADIVNYRSMEIAPAFLGVTLAAGAVIALGLTLVASVRRRRHDLALLKTLGFTRRQLAAVVAWQSSIAVLIGTVAGITIGIVLGRFLWNTFAHEINAVPAPAVPALTIVLIALGALVLANVVAAVPGRIAARTPTAFLLRAD